MAMVVAFIGLPYCAQAGTATEVVEASHQMDELAASHGQRNVIDKISHDFNEFTGSETNAERLVSGLRDGTEIELEDGTVVSPATAHQGWGNVFITLALAEQQLTDMGITDPTGDQIKAALEGGTIEILNEDGTITTVDLEGITQMRAHGMGWGQIAKANGVKLGHLVSRIKSAKHRVERALPHGLEKKVDKTAKVDNVRSRDKFERGRRLGFDRAKLDRIDKQFDRPEKVTRPDKIERPEKVVRPDKIERPEKVKRPEKPERPSRPGKG